MDPSVAVRFEERIPIFDEYSGGNGDGASGRLLGESLEIDEYVNLRLAAD